MPADEYQIGGAQAADQGVVEENKEEEQNEPAQIPEKAPSVFNEPEQQ